MTEQEKAAQNMKDREFVRDAGLGTWSINFSSYENGGDHRFEVPYENANAYGSSRTKGRGDDNTKHAILLDIYRHQVKVMPSSTDGHCHVVVDAHVDWIDYKALLLLLAKMGIVDRGYAIGMIDRGQAFLRMPGCRKAKGDEESCYEEPS